MINRSSYSVQESCGLPPRPVAGCQLVAITHPIKGQTAFGNIVTAVNAAILREISVKGEQSRFVKPAPGRFALKPASPEAQS